MKLFGKFILMFLAILACFIITFSSFPALLLPVGTIIWFISTTPCWIVFTRILPGNLHPFFSTFIATELMCVFFDMTWPFLFYCITYFARYFNSLILMMINTSFWILALPLIVTSSITKKISGSVNICLFFGNLFAAITAYYFDFGSSVVIERANFWVISFVQRVTIPTTEYSVSTRDRFKGFSTLFTVGRDSFSWSTHGGTL